MRTRHIGILQIETRHTEILGLLELDTLIFGTLRFDQFIDSDTYDTRHIYSDIFTEAFNRFDSNMERFSSSLDDRLSNLWRGFPRMKLIVWAGKMSCTQEPSGFPRHSGVITP
jgi:hypothetical protein